MISCAYALLVLNCGPSHRPSPYDDLVCQKNIDLYGTRFLQSLVFLADGLKSSFYGAYELPSDGRFPRPNVNFDIVKTIDSSYDLYTKVAAYCSPTLSSIEIVDTFKDDLSPMTKSYYAGKSVMKESEGNCDKLIQKEWNTMLDNRSKIKILAQNNLCSSRDIISLAHRGFLSVTGIYSKMAPTNINEDTKKLMKHEGSSPPENNVPLVNIMNSVALVEMISYNHNLGICKIGRKNIVLVWYFGHLHLFEKDRKGNLWWPNTNIDLDMRNGALILQFMRSCFNLFHQLDAKIAEYGPLERAIDYVTCSDCIGLSMGEKYRRLMGEIGQLTIKKKRNPDGLDLSRYY